MSTNQTAKAWRERVTIPTYRAGEPEHNPIFLEKRVYQGSNGKVYPYPVIEKIADEATNDVYNAVYLENDYLKIMILPELGGRVQMAYDKVKKRHFIYYNQVIKPALVGLAGPWISGGIEFNWPQHHRPSTFMPVDHTIEQGADGSVTVWVNERERMFHQQGAAGFTLYPDRAYLEIKGRLYNPMPLPQTFLWWANPAVSVGDHYQSIFPPDVHAVFDHGKRDVSDFPIAHGTYYKVDYSAGVDISRYKNIPVPTSYMAVMSDYNFVGGYENDTRAGVLHVANHHLSPGKKQWTWGNCDFGTAWDRNLTDEDGPYIELMAGVFTDNQPDFSWMQPYENKDFTQYFLPYRELGVVKNASRDLLLNMEQEGDELVVKLFATAAHKAMRVVVCDMSSSPLRALLDHSIEISPLAHFETRIPMGGSLYEDLKIVATTPDNGPSLGWQPERRGDKATPDAARPAKLPEQIDSTEQLYLTGLHLEQYRHATYNPLDYYREALRREPGDVRCNNAMGLYLVRCGLFAEAEDYLRRAVETLTERNPNPYDGEPLYNLGLALQGQGKYREAYDSFYKACWNGAWQMAGYFALAQISTARGDLQSALHETRESMLRGWHNHRARHLLAALLRHSGQTGEAMHSIEESLTIDPFNFGCLFERFTIAYESKSALAPEYLSELKRIMNDSAHNYETLALDYINAGLYIDASQLLLLATLECSATTPMTYYYKGWAEACAGLENDARSSFATAQAHAPGCCFPNRTEAIAALECAMAIAPTDAKAPYYLGNLWYDKRCYDRAVAAWERSASLDESFPTVRRNLSLAYFNKLDRAQDAVAMLERAFALDTTDARVLMELDQLYKRLGRAHAERLALLESHPALVELRDDLYLERVTLLNQLGRYTEARALLDSRHFHPWEGGEGKVPAQYQISRLELAKTAINEGHLNEAIDLLEQCRVYPHNLGEGKLAGAQENDFLYYLGVAYAALGDTTRATSLWKEACKGPTEPAAAIFYNDQKPDKIYYQGLALLKLGRTDEALARFDRLVSYGTEHLDDKVVMDYFAVSLPDLLIWEDDLTHRNRIHCLYLMGLGAMGRAVALGSESDNQQAKKLSAEVHKLDINHQGVRF